MLKPLQGLIVDTLVPENLDVHALPWLPLEQRHALPKVAALYFVLDADRAIAYIGRTISLQQRWAHHHRRKTYVTRPGMTIAWLVVSDPALLPDLEAACIAFFLPRDNPPPSDAPMTRANIYIDETLWLAFRHACLDHHISASQAITELMRQQLVQWQREAGDDHEE